MIKYKVLLINVFEEIVNRISEELCDDYIVITMETDGDYLEEVHQIKPDVILLAVNMPDIYGFEVCEQLKQDPMTIQIPILLISTFEDNFDVAHGLELGAVDYIRLPFEPAVLKRRIRTYMRLHSQNYFLEAEVKSRMLSLDKAYQELLSLLSQLVEYRDYALSQHVFRVGEYAYVIGKDLGFDDENATRLKLAAQLHDIGKIAITDGILLKKGKLNFEEWQGMTHHAFIGGKLIERYESDLLVLAKRIAEQHHEWYNGEGYPNNLLGEEICLEARIVSICDVFDALMNDRIYREAWSYNHIIDYIRKQSDGQFDPKIVDSFINNLDKLLDINKELSDDEKLE
ncbi:MAG: HD domain-containing protein [Clostridiales bacterium]|nr:HD domain-containing protein [Clostridiales bacterium]